MVKIPEKMGNEESKLVAGIVVAERKLAIAESNHQSAVLRYENFKKRIS